MRGIIEESNINPLWKIYIQKAYFIRKGFIKLSLDDYYNMLTREASYLYIINSELDLIRKEELEKDKSKYTGDRLRW